MSKVSTKNVRGDMSALRRMFDFGQEKTQPRGTRPGRRLSNDSVRAIEQDAIYSILSYAAMACRA